MSAPARRRPPPPDPRQGALTAALLGLVLAVSAAPLMLSPAPRPRRFLAGDVVLKLAPTSRPPLRWCVDPFQMRPRRHDRYPNIVWRLDPLRWLAWRQEEDGSWPPNGSEDRRLRATAFASLAFTREGARPRGVVWLSRHVLRAPPGDDRDLAALALVEAYAMSREDWLEAPARWCLKAGGGSGWMRRARRVAAFAGLVEDAPGWPLEPPASPLDPFSDAAALASDRPESEERRDRWIAGIKERRVARPGCCGTGTSFWPDQGPTLTPAGAIEATAKALWLRQAADAYSSEFWWPL